MLACSFFFVFLIIASLQVFLNGLSQDARDSGALSSPSPSAAVSLGGTSAGEVEFATIVQGWSAVPWAFSKCRSTFEQRPPAKTAIQAINSLQSSIKIVVAQHSICKLCRSLGTQSTYYVEFQQIIRQIFVSWQSVLLDGAQKYRQEWKTAVGLGFKTFDSFLITIYNMCISLQIDLSVIFRSIHLNYQLFIEVGLNLVQILKLQIDVSTTGHAPQASIQSSAPSGKQPLPYPSKNNTVGTPLHGSVQSSTSNQKQLPNNVTNVPALTTLAGNITNSPALVVHKNLGQASTGAGNQELVLIVQAWSGLPIAFGKCKTVFEQKASPSIALQAVATLHATVQSAITRYGTCKSCTSSNAQDASYLEFQRELREIFTLWQSLLSTGEQQYKAQWSSSFKAEFAQFDQFLVAIYNISSSLKLDLRALLVSIYFKSELFLRVGLNLSSRLNPLQPSGTIRGKFQGGLTPAASGVTPIYGAAVPGLKGAGPAKGNNIAAVGTLASGASGIASESAERGLSLVVQGWSTVPKAFADCQFAFERHVPINAAIQAIATLHATIQSAVSHYGSCEACAGLAASSPTMIKFRGLIAQILSSWQGALEVGQKSYQLQWRSSLAVQFKKFDSFWAVIQNFSASLHLNLGTLLSSIHLNASAFADIGINLGLQINGQVDVGPHALQATTSDIPVHGISAIVYGWASLPTAFIKCQSTLQNHVPVNVALQAIATLRATFQSTISKYGSCNSCSASYPQSALAVRFRGTISQIFTSWQAIITTARAQYGAQWQNISGEFTQFSPFLLSVKEICSSMKINLGALFGEIHLNTALFSGVGLNLEAHLNLSLGGRIGGDSCSGNLFDDGFRTCLLKDFKVI